MRSALDKVKGALAAKGFGINLNWYILSNDRISATDGRMSASAPFKHGLNRAVPGEQLEQLLARLPDGVSISNDADSITLRAGRLRGTIATLPPDDKLVVEPDRTWETPPAGLVAALKMARPFVADVAAQPYGTCLCLRDGSILATTNLSLVQVLLPALAPGEEDLLLPAWAADFVIKAKATLDGVIFTPSYVAFHWDDGLWFRSQLVTGQFPESVTTMLSGVAAEQPIEMTPGWRTAYADVAALSESLVIIHPDRITGGREHSNVEAATEPPIALKEPVPFNPKYLTAVVDLATHWDPGAFPRPIPFVAPGVRGLVVGRRA